MSQDLYPELGKKEKKKKKSTKQQSTLNKKKITKLNNGQKI